MVKKHLKYLILILIVICVKSNAQMLLPSLQNGVDKYPNFNPEYIKKHNIKSLVFDIIDKKDLQVAVDKGLIHSYEFNKEGKLTRFYYTVVSKTITQEIHTGAVYKKRKKISNGGVYYKNEYVYDTISTRFYYDDKNRLTHSRYNDGAYYEAMYYEYNEDDLVTKIIRAKETNVSEDKSSFQLGIQTVLSDERFQYVKLGDKQLKKLCLNDENRVFKEIIMTYDECKYITSLNESFTATWISQESKFAYNFNHQMIEKTYKSNSGGTLQTKSTFEYDTKGNLLTEKQYKNDVLYNELSYLFDDSDQRVKSYLNRDHINKSIRITKVIYTFWSTVVER